MFLSRLLFKQVLSHTRYISVNSKFRRFYSTSIGKMSDDNSIDCNCGGMDLQSIVKSLEEFASINLAESWDNVGLLVDPMDTRDVKSILLTNDLTESVMNEAVNLDIDLIIAYHPPIFKGLKTLNGRHWKERLIITCMKNGIAIYSPHTSWDVVQGGVNDWLAKAFTVKSSVPITDTGCGRLCQLSKPTELNDLIAQLKKHIGIPHVRLACAAGKEIGRKITSVALCAGSGSSVLNGVEADLYLTGEMQHHDVLEATQNGSHVILCNHSDSERGFLKEFAPKLEKLILGGLVKVYVSEVDVDPLTTV